MSPVESIEHATGSEKPRHPGPKPNPIYESLAQGVLEHIDTEQGALITISLSGDETENRYRSGLVNAFRRRGISIRINKIDDGSDSDNKLKLRVTRAPARKHRD